MAVVPQTIRTAVEVFIADVERRLELRTTEGPEAILAAPIRTLFQAIAEERGRPDFDLLDQAIERGIGTPDFAARDGHLLIGHLETKRLGVGADPARFRDAHDRAQWERFKRLPNLIYTDGSDFALFRSGETVTLAEGRPARARLPIAPGRRGPHTTADTEIGELASMLDVFFSWEPITPRTLRDLAARLAPLVATLRGAVREALEEAESPISLVTNEVRDTLFPDADDDALADAYAQTCAYSLLLAQAEGATALDAASVEATLTHAHPVLARVVRVLLEPDAERQIAWAVEIVRRQVGAIDFAELTETSGPDTWLYFYEEFLAAYDPALRNNRGVYYTPRQVISAQVALCEDLLRSRFAKPLAFAEPTVTVVDPGAGTGGYPLAVLAAASDAAEGLGEGAVAAAVTNLAERLHAFEILVGPYSVAHLRLTEAIRDKGATPPTDGVKVYLTDTLASPNVDPPLISTLMPLVREQRRARRFKSETPVVVCLGNPPYDREEHEEGHERPRKGGWVRYGDPGQVEHSRPILDDWLEPLRAAGGGVHAKNLYNDYIYFWRWAIWKVLQHHPEAVRECGGIVTFISASSFLRGPAMAYMRRHMRQLCDDVYVLDLGGEGRGTRQTENVFDILVPVAITFCVRYPGGGERAGRVHYADWSVGTEEEKLAQLDSLETLDDIAWLSGPSGETDPFIPGASGDWADWPLLTDLFPWRHTGVQTKRTWPVAPTRECLRARWRALSAASDAEKRELFHETRDRTIRSTPQPLLLSAVGRPAIVSLSAGEELADADISSFEFRSLDQEFIVRDERIGDFLKPVLWRSWSDRQLYISTLTTHPISDGPGVTVASCSPPDLHFYRGSFGGADTMPLYRDADATSPNLPAGVLELLAECYGRGVTAEDLFAYVVGVLGTGAYTSRFTVELAEPPPRLPLTRDPGLFEQAAELGRRLCFLQSRGERFAGQGWTLPTGAARITTPIPSGEAECPDTQAYNEETQALAIGSGVVEPVPPEVYRFETSGYQIVFEWIARRLARPRGRTSSELDLIRPIAWNFDLQRELLQVLHIVEEVVHELTPHADELLEVIAAGEVVRGAELPVPTDAERRAPRSA